MREMWAMKVSLYMTGFGNKAVNVLQHLFVVSTVFIVFLLPEKMACAADPIDADGPDFVNSAGVIGKDHFQYEADLVTQQDRRMPAQIQTTSLPILMKYGTSDTTELRVVFGGYTSVNDSNIGGATQTGISDSSVGMKWHIQDKDAKAAKPAISLIVMEEAPSGTNGYNKPGFQPSISTVLSWDLPQDFTFGLMPGIKYDTASDGHRFTSASLGVDLSRQMSEKLRTFVEYGAQQFAAGADGGTVADWDIGAAYLLTNDSQLGVRAGFAANQNTPSNYLLIELAQRF